MHRLVLILLVLALGGCTPLVFQQAGKPPLGFEGPRFEQSRFVSFDGARLGLQRWDARGADPWAVVIALHGMNDYANAFHIAGPAWAEAGVTTYAYDQRGFGRSPRRGLWADDEVLAEDLRTAVTLARRNHPNALVAVVGESMGGAVAATAFASDRPPAADRLVLLSPAVWGWRSQPLPNRTLLWLAANFTAGKVYTPPRWVTAKITPTDNRDELIAMGRDPLMIWGARSDALYGLVRLMDDAAEAVGDDTVPTLYLYGANDQIIPRKAALKAAKGLTREDRSAYYTRGYHLLTRDRQGRVVMDDVLAFLRDPKAPLPSGAPPIPGAATPAAPDRRAAGL
jgi:alpha-beta hydrolase superfamily lysophospholipase